MRYVWTYLCHVTLKWFIMENDVRLGVVEKVEMNSVSLTEYLKNQNMIKYLNYLVICK